jgi:hypothetical protein
MLFPRLRARCPFFAREDWRGLSFRGRTAPPDPVVTGDLPEARRAILIVLERLMRRDLGR